ncbi:hypothetical protein VYU27_010375, partial [Nannochloropsis oceanica]
LQSLGWLPSDVIAAVLSRQGSQAALEMEVRDLVEDCCLSPLQDLAGARRYLHSPALRALASSEDLGGRGSSSSSSSSSSFVGRLLDLVLRLEEGDRGFDELSRDVTKVGAPSLQQLSRAGLGLLARGVKSLVGGVGAGQGIVDRPFLVLFILGGISPEELRCVEQVLLISTALLSPEGMYTHTFL